MTQVTQIDSRVTQGGLESLVRCRNAAPSDVSASQTPIDSRISRETPRSRRVEHAPRSAALQQPPAERAPPPPVCSRTFSAFAAHSAHPHTLRPRPLCPHSWPLCTFAHSFGNVRAEVQRGWGEPGQRSQCSADVTLMLRCCYANVPLMFRWRVVLASVLRVHPSSSEQKGNTV